MASRQIRTLMLCLFAVFAVSATAASTASAKRVWTVCEPTTGGKYSNSKCTEEAGAKTFEDVVMPVGKTRKIEVVKVVAPTILTAGTNVIECKKVEIVGGEIENVLVETKGPTGIDRGTLKFTECSNPKPCEVKSPGEPNKTIVVEKPVTALVENTTKAKIYDVFRPKGTKELTPAEVTAKGEPASKEHEEELKEFVKIEQTGTGCVTPITVESNGVAAEIEPATPSVTKIFKFPGKNTKCSPIGAPLSPVIFWNGVEAGLKLKAFGVAAEECGEVEVQLSTKEKWDVQ